MAEPKVAVAVPAKFQRFLERPGSYRKWLKMTVYGPPKSGKSYLTAGMPKRDGKPRLFLDSGERGIMMYVEPDDIVMTVGGPEDLVDVLEWGVNEVNQKGTISGIGVDGYSLFWKTRWDEVQKDSRLANRDKPRGQDYDWIKEPVRRLRALGFAAKCDFVLTAWHKTMVIEAQEGQPGMTAAPAPHEWDAADIEKTLPYLFDFAFKVEGELSPKGVPTGKHIITFRGGRVPLSVPADRLHLGKRWTFDERKRKTPREVWDEVIGWIEPFRAAGVEDQTIGMDEEARVAAVRGLSEELESEALGRIRRAIEDADSLPALKAAFEGTVTVLAMALSPAERTRVQGWVNERKAALGGNGAAA